MFAISDISRQTFSHKQTLQIKFKSAIYQSLYPFFDVYLLFAIWMGQIQ